MGGVRSMFLPSCSSLLIFLSPLGERLGEGVNPKIVSCITPSPRLSPKGERSMRAEDHEAETDEPDPEAINPIPPFAGCYQVRHHRAMSTIKRLSFIGLEYSFAPAKAYGMSRGGGFRRPGGLVEVETDAGVRGIGEAFGNPRVTLEYFRMVEPMFTGQSVFDFDHVEARIRNAMYHLGVGNQLTACLAGINVALYDAIARGFGVRVC